MYFERFYDEDLAQASYLLACQASGEAVVVDPRRDVGVYLAEVARRNFRLVAVTETHIHADYLSGSRELAEATGATLYLSDEGDDSWRYGFAGVGLRDGDEIRLGRVRLRAVHTPGHTPEHLCFLVTDGAAADGPAALLSGDFVFAGDVGRPDLLDEAAGFTDTRFAAARLLYATLRDRFLALPDYVQVWPGHGAGSACGKSLGAVPSTTVGYERRFSWWSPFLERGDEEGFVAALLEGQPEAPRYFGRMKRQNRDGPALLGDREVIRRLAPEEVAGRIGHDLLLVDTRPSELHRRDAIEGALHLPYGRSFATYASYVIDPEREERPLVLLASDGDQAEEMRDRLARVGIDRVEGYVDGLEGLRRSPLRTIGPEALASLEDPFILDVRSAAERREGHIPGSFQLHAGAVMWRTDSLPRDRRLVIHCQSGARAAVVGSALRIAGFDVIELEGSFRGWRELQDDLHRV